MAQASHCDQAGRAALPDTCMEAFACMAAESILAGKEPDLHAVYIAAGFPATDRAFFIAQTLWEDEDIQARIAALVKR
jgi:hypothetical protein